MASIGQFLPLLGRRFGDRVAVRAWWSPLPSPLVLAVAFDLSSIASIGSAIALVVFTLVTVGHIRARGETGARLPVLLLALPERSPSW